MRHLHSIRKIISIILVFLLVESPFTGHAHGAWMATLPEPGTRIGLSSIFTPPLLKGIRIHPENPFRFDFILDKGDSTGSEDQVKEQSNKLVKYFLASLTIPENDLWVNLSPYEKDRVVADAFGQTEMGRDLLAQDYILKQITSSVIYPEGKIGKEFWAKVYVEAQKRFGTTDVPVDTFNKVWILPEKADVFENLSSGTAYIIEARFKVMLDEDYLALAQGTADQRSHINSKEINKLGADIIRKIVIPILEKEVNEGENFKQLRQIYSSLILATWFKRKVKNGLLNSVYVDQKKTGGVDFEDKTANQEIYKQYLEAFKIGVFNYIKEEYDQNSQQTIPRKYFAGGAGLNRIGNVFHESSDRVMFQKRLVLPTKSYALEVDLAQVGHTSDRAMVDLKLDSISRANKRVSPDNESLRASLNTRSIWAGEEISDAGYVFSVSKGRGAARFLD
ncbi:MAG: hypothetical protein WCI27_11975, partial [Candidatus Omnitrophota bacterium]